MALGHLQSTLSPSLSVSFFLCRSIPALCYDARRMAGDNSVVQGSYKKSLGVSKGLSLQ